MPLTEDTPAVQTEPAITRAAGVLFVAPDGNILLVHRTDSLGWAFPGGRIEDGESAEEAARREVFEETGYKYEGPLSLWTRCVSNSVDFTTFLARTPQFQPVLNEEHDRCQWVDRQFALNTACGPCGLHTGVPIALRRFDMDELCIAEAIKAGELTSPQRYQNLLLIAIRITGTGVAYRGAYDEYPFRDPALYLTDEFLQRCNGLPVILEHPKGNMLDTEEFRQRIVGTVFLPYTKEQEREVWAVAKIWSEPVARMLETERMSTSPAVICGGAKLALEDGSTLLIEAKPRLLDHIALLFADEDGEGGKGVWDKLGPMSGVESIDAADPEEYVKLDAVVRRTKLYQLVDLLNR